MDIEVNNISTPFVRNLNALRIWALILGICCGIALLGVNPRIPVHRPTMDVPRQAWFPKDIHHLKTPLTFLLIGITVFQALGFFPVSLFIPTYTSSLSSATLPSTIVLALFNATSVIFFIVFGHYCDKYPYPYVILVSGIGSALAAFILWGFASSLGWVFAFAVIFGGLVRMFYIKLVFLFYSQTRGRTEDSRRSGQLQLLKLEASGHFFSSSHQLEIDIDNIYRDA
jgi:predicted MFS family arabinose efflux permease